MRSEQEVFEELAALCSSPGYVHAIAYLCYRDNIVKFAEEMKPEDTLHQYSDERLIRTELCTLIGLLLKYEIDWSLPEPGKLHDYVSRSESLLSEIHQIVLSPMRVPFEPLKTSAKKAKPPVTGAILRETFFYGGESAYSFQYRDFAPRKYEKDNAWLTSNKGFSISSARNIVHAITMIQEEKLLSEYRILLTKPEIERTILPGFVFDTNEVAMRSGVALEETERVLSSFAVPVGERNAQFTAVSAFNAIDAYPLIPMGVGRFVSFHQYSLTAALYESPFYWMSADRAYVDTAMRNRGLFTEEFATERLATVFSAERVHPNVNLFDPKGNKLGEIDALVIFGNRAIVLQAKSKRLTIKAREGNDGRIRDDFKASVQDACDQGYRCAKLMLKSAPVLKDSASREIALPSSFAEVYVLCVVADHYPALFFQAKQFLKFEKNRGIAPPFVLDIFALDAMAEMLASPLQFLSYINRRTNYHDKILASHELVILSYHLKRNLWLGEKHDFFALHDDISTDLNIAMYARRDGVPGNPIPDGILTRFANTSLGRLVRSIERSPHPATIDLGFALLTLAEDTVNNVSQGIDTIVALARKDGGSHDVTFRLAGGDTGLTIHCNSDIPDVAGPSLQRHCHARKYKEKANNWFGICIDPQSAAPRFGLNLRFTWERDRRMDGLTEKMGKPKALSELFRSSPRRRFNVGKNHACPCGSGKTYKRCCLPR